MVVGNAANWGNLIAESQLLSMPFKAFLLYNYSMDNDQYGPDIFLETLMWWS